MEVEMTDTPNPKRSRGRPRLNRPPKIALRPYAIKGGKTFRATLDPFQADKLDRYRAINNLHSEAAAIRAMIDALPL